MDTENNTSTNINSNADKEKKLIDSIWVGFIGNYYTTYYNQLIQKMEEEQNGGDVINTKSETKPASKYISSQDFILFLQCLLNPMADVSRDEKAEQLHKLHLDFCKIQISNIRTSFMFDKQTNTQMLAF